MKKERDLLQPFIKQLKECDYYFTHKDGDTFGGHKKLYDFYIVHIGMHLAVEAKRSPKEELSDHQKEALQKVNEAGGYSFVARFNVPGHEPESLVFYPYMDGKERKDIYYVSHCVKGVYSGVYFLPEALKELHHKV